MNDRTKRHISVFKKCPSKVYLRSDTVFLKHFREKQKSRQHELTEEQRKILEKKKHIIRKTAFLQRNLQQKSLVPLSCLFSQIGNDKFKLHMLPDYVESVLAILKVLNKSGMCGKRLKVLVRNGQFEQLETVVLSGNNIGEHDCYTVALMLKKSKNLKRFSLRANNLEENGCQELGVELSHHKNLQELDISWNHIRRHGAIDISRAIKKNISLTFLNVSWNGFAFEGCSALSEALENNKNLKQLDLSWNRVHPPALLELMKGLCRNATLQKLNLSHNPITPPFTSIFLQALFDTNFTGLTEIIMEKIVVDHDFPELLQKIQEHQELKVIFEKALPLRIRPEKLRMEVQGPAVFNMDPLKLLYLLKEKNRAQDFFNKINKDNNDVVTIDEIQTLFTDMGVSVTRSVVEKIMDFMDTDNSGAIDLGEFLEGDRRIRKMSRDFARSSRQQIKREYNKYSRSFTRAHIDPMTFQLKIQEPKQLLPPIQSREPSISPVMR
ncbi:leucine-rich repeat-containing protein 74B-like isoform X2 [Mytilus edulis]|uniref:leucine-rich repeat-containing protein 74B-like isoform X2 n=1 Tax=Mytilus edulis TaxID=6550 RepID=UPI0039EEF30B